MPELSQSALDRLRWLLSELEEGARQVDALIAAGDVDAIAAKDANFAAGLRFAINCIEVDFIGKLGGA